MEHKLDSTDIQILRLLQQDSEITLKEIADQLKISTTPVHERIRKLQKRGYILKKVALLNAHKLGLKLTAFLSISISDHSREAVDEFVTQVISFPEVLECHHVSGKSDFFLKVVLEDIPKYNEFVLSRISNVPNISRIETSFALSVRKLTHEIPI